MMKTTTTLMLAVFGLALGATTAQAAAVTITNCAAPPVTIFNKKTVVNLPGDDVTIQCALNSLPGSDQTQVTAGSIVIDGPNGGSVSSTGKGNQATLLQATGAITLLDASVIAANSNARTVLEAGGDITITAGSTLSAGLRVAISCTGPLCKINIAGTTISGNEVVIAGDGTVTISPASTILTSCPRDLIQITSANGDVLLGGGAFGGLATICCNSVLAACSANPNDPACPFAGGGGPIVLNNLQEVAGFCADCLAEPNLLKGCVEGDIIILAPRGNIDVSNAVLMAGEGIVLTAQGNINAENSNISNCGPKTGVVVLTSATCNVQNATILDDDPELLPTLNCAQNGVAALLGTCSSKHP
jgi:hypothetical protein